MRTLPVNLVVDNRQAVVIGGGKVAARKIQSLLGAGAKVKVFAGLGASCPDEFHGSVDWVAKDFSPASAEQARDLASAMIVFACCDDSAVNAAIAQKCRQCGVLVNCVDQPDDCDFFCPAVASDGEVTIAIGTGGLAPALAGRLRQDIQNALPEKLGDFTAALNAIRKKFMASSIPADKRMRALREISSDEYHKVFIAQGQAGLELAAEELLKKQKD